MLHRLCGPPSIPLSFSLAAVFPRRSTYRVCYATNSTEVKPTASTHRLQRGLPGYLILFDPHAFGSQRQCWPSYSPSPPVFLLISTYFTTTPTIPVASTTLKISSIKCTSRVEPWDFTPDLEIRLHPLYAQ